MGKALILLALLGSDFIYTKCACPADIFDQEPPQFQIIAAAKTGSTSLYSYLCNFPSIECFAKKKELNLLRDGKMKIRSAKVKNFVLKVNISKEILRKRRRRKLYRPTERRVSISIYLVIIQKDALHSRLPFTTIIIKVPW